MNIRNVDMLKLENKQNNIIKLLFWLLIIGMPLHTMLVDKIIGNLAFSFGGLINLWRDAIIFFLLIYAVWSQWGQRLSRMGVVILCVIGMICLFWLFSGAPFLLKTNILRIYAIPMLMFFVMQRFYMDETMYNKLLLVLFVQGVGLALFGLFQVFILGKEFLTEIGYGEAGALHHSFYIGGWRGFQRMVSTFASPNNCGLYLTQLFTICWVNKDRLNKYRKWTGAGFLVMLIGIIATFSRSAWVSLFVVVALYFIIHEKNKKRLLNWRNGALVAGVLLVLWLLDLVLLNSRMTKMILSSIMGVVTGSDASFMKHLEDLVSPLTNILRNPLGYGFGTSGPIALNVLGEGTRLVESSLWLVGYDMGIPGLILYFTPYLRMTFGIANKKDTYRRTAAYLTLATMVIFCILPLYQNVDSTFLVFTFMGIARNPRLSAAAQESAAAQ